MASDNEGREICEPRPYFLSLIVCALCNLPRWGAEGSRMGGRGGGRGVRGCVR